MIGAQAEDKPDFNPWPAMATLLIANFMNLIDVTIVNVALPSMQRGLGASASQIEWIVAGYILIFALGLLPMGRIGDIVGRKRVFLIGVGCFTLASAICGLAPNTGMLVFARVFQGASAAVMMPQVLAIAQNLFPPRQRASAFALFSLTAGLASVAGPLLGGLLISMDLWGLGWRPIFLINLPIGLAAILFGIRLIPDIRGDHGMRNDWVGIGIVAPALFCIVFPLVEGRNLGWPLWLFAMMAAAVPLLVGFVLWERHQAKRDAPQLLPVTLLSNWNFAIGSAMSMIFFSALPAFFLVFALFLQNGFGFTPLESGLTTVPFPVGVLIASIITSRLGADWLRFRIFIGLVLLWFSIFVLRQLVLAEGVTLNHWNYVVPLFFAGLGLGLSIAPLFQAILQGVPVHDAGSGSGALQAIQQAGGALGIAVVSQVFFSTLGMATARGVESHAAYSAAFSAAMVYNLWAYVLVAIGALVLRGADNGQPAARQPIPVE